MILADTSVWVDHFQGSERASGLAELLENNVILGHPWVHGELALGGLGQRREQVLADLQRLPPAPEIAAGEMLELVEARHLSGRGIGWVDVQLLGSALVAEARLWTFDSRLRGVAADLGLAVEDDTIPP